MKRGDPITAAEIDAVGFKGWRQVWLLSVESSHVTARFDPPRFQTPWGYNFYLRYDVEGVVWCRGHEGPQVEAMKAAWSL